jgi:hypothetical protein
MALLGDEQASGVRRLLIEKTGIMCIEAFPQKDDPRNRVFHEAKLSTSVFATNARHTGSAFLVRTYPGRYLSGASACLRLAPNDIIKFDPINVTIPSCTQRDLDIAIKIISRDKMGRIDDYCRAFQGEINETTDGKRGLVSKNPKDGPQVLRGSTICLYTLREPSQGEAIYLRKEKYVKQKSVSEKARHHKQKRVGWQESSPQNNFRRIIATIIPEGQFCNHKINYIPQNESKLPLDLVMILLNSKVSDWYFRLGSTNAAVSHYQIYTLPCPTFVLTGEDIQSLYPLHNKKWSELAKELCDSCIEVGVIQTPIAEAFVEMARRLQQIESQRALHSRSERSHLAPESQSIQDAIDKVLYKVYGLTEEEGRYIEKRLKEML